MKKIAVCDDNECMAVNLQKMILDYDFEEKMEVHCFFDGNSLIKNVQKNSYDIIMIDIKLSDDEKSDNGIIISKKIKEFYPATIIIFISAFTIYYKDLAQAESFQFILKPFKKEDIYAVINKALNRILTTMKSTYSYCSNSITFEVDANEIIYAYSVTPKIILNLINNEESSFYGKLDCVELELKKLNPNFVRTGKSYLVNISYITGVTKTRIILFNGYTITITRKYKNEFHEVYQNYRKRIYSLSSQTIH